MNNLGSKKYGKFNNMAIGYASVILKSYKSSFNDFLDTVSREFLLLSTDSTILTLDDVGEHVILTVNEAVNSYNEKQQIAFKFRSVDGNAMTCTVTDMGGLVEENYSMDELLSNEDENQLFQFIQKRYESLRIAGFGIGFIFDTEGYSEDYIKIAYDAWRN